jgi:hypothetical protein
MKVDTINQPLKSDIRPTPWLTLNSPPPWATTTPAQYQAFRVLGMHQAPPRAFEKFVLPLFPLKPAHAGRN